MHVQYDLLYNLTHASMRPQIGVAFYEMLQAVDHQSKHLAYMDPICDFLYHIKYMFTGDSVKDQVYTLMSSVSTIALSVPQWPPTLPLSVPQWTPTLRLSVSQ